MWPLLENIFEYWPTPSCIQRGSREDRVDFSFWNVLCLSVCLVWANFLFFIQYSTEEYSTVQVHDITGQLQVRPMLYTYNLQSRDGGQKLENLPRTDRQTHREFSYRGLSYPLWIVGGSGPIITIMDYYYTFPLIITQNRQIALKLR